MCARKAIVGEGYGIEGSKLMRLFEEALKEIYWVEKNIIKSLLKMSKKASEPQLIHLLESHLTESEEQIEKLEKIFTLIGRRSQAHKTEVIVSMMEEVKTLLDAKENGAARDAEIIMAARKWEHYEIAMYSHLCTYAEKLKMDEVLELLQSILNEEMAADTALADIAGNTIQIQARNAP